VYLKQPIYQMVAEYAVSQYVLSHYRPLVNVDGQLVMIRSDLKVDPARARAVDAAGRTQGLYFDMAACGWGYSLNFLKPLPTGPRHVQLEVERLSRSHGSTIYRLEVPGVTTADRFSSLTVRSQGVTLGANDFTLGDTLDAPGHDITFWSLPRGSTLTVPVSSCLQWHGFSTRTLYLRQYGRALLRSVSLTR
jgi:hypothetical protein